MTFATFYPPLWHCFHSPGLRLRASKGWPWARWRWTWGGWNSVSAIWWMYTVKKAALKGGSKVSHFVFKACGVLTEYVVTRWYRAPEAGFLFFFVEWLCLFVYAQLLCWPQWKSRCSRWCCCRSSIQPQWTSGLLDSQIFLPGPGSVDSWDFLRLVASLAKFLEGRQGSPEIWQNWPGQLAMLVAWTFTHWHPLTWLNLLCNKLWSNHRPCSLVRTILIWIGPEFFWIENIRHSNLWKIGFFLRAGWGMYGGQGAWKSCWFWSQLASEGEIFVRVVTAGSCRLTCKVLKIWPMAGYWCIPLPAKGILPVGFSGFFSVLPMCFQLMMNENLAGLSSRFWCKLGCARIFPSKFFHLWSTVTFFFNHMFLLEMIYIYIYILLQSRLADRQLRCIRVLLRHAWICWRLCCAWSLNKVAEKNHLAFSCACNCDTSEVGIRKSALQQQKHKNMSAPNNKWTENNKYVMLLFFWWESLKLAGFLLFFYVFNHVTFKPPGMWSTIILGSHHNLPNPLTGLGGLWNVIHTARHKGFPFEALLIGVSFLEGPLMASNRQQKPFRPGPGPAGNTENLGLYWILRRSLRKSHFLLQGKAIRRAVHLVNIKQTPWKKQGLKMIGHFVVSRSSLRSWLEFLRMFALWGSNWYQFQWHYHTALPHTLKLCRNFQQSVDYCKPIIVLSKMHLGGLACDKMISSYS